MVLSIITINLNNASGLQETIDSVKRQRFLPEYIIVDGGSVDGSIAIINKEKEIITKKTIAPDKGIYDAMNKGLEMATGEYVLFLNSGDVLVEDIDYELLMTNRAGFIIYGTDLNNGYQKIAKEPIMPFIREFSLPHQSTFIKRKLFDVWGNYNVNYKVTGDFEWFCRVFTQSNPSRILKNELLVKMQPGGIGSYPNCDWYLERDWVLFKYFYSWDILNTLKGCWRIWIRSFKEPKFKNRSDIF
jgi:glycosyltransferase involved in cell wall biosynthesis